MMRWFVLLLLCSQVGATCHVATFAGAGTKSGADWTNAAQWGVTSGFTGSTLIAGDSYYLADTPSIINNTLAGATIATTTGTITRVSGSFVADGVTVGMRVRFTGFTSLRINDVWYTVTNVTALVLTVSDPNSYLVNETSASGAVSYEAVSTSNYYPAITVTKSNVIIRKARSADHCTDTGWVLGTMGTYQAFFGGSVFLSTATGSVFDGNGLTTKTSGHGFVVDGINIAGTSEIMLDAGPASTIQYVDAFGRGVVDNPIPTVVNTLNGATVTVASDGSGHQILTITGMGIGANGQSGVAVSGSLYKTDNNVSPGTFLRNQILTVCTPSDNAACISPTATSFSAITSFSNYGPTAQTAGNANVNIFVNAVRVKVAGANINHNYLHDTSDTIILYGASSGLNMQYNVLANDSASLYAHGGGTCGNSGNNYTPTTFDLTEMFNDFQNIHGTANHDFLVGAAVAPFAISSVQVATNVLTVNGATFGATPPVGNPFYLTGLTTATFLNGQVVRIVSATTTSFTAAFTHADYNCTGSPCADTGKVIPTNDNLKFIGNSYSSTPGNSAAAGDGIWFLQTTLPYIGAATNVVFQNNTAMNMQNMFLFSTNGSIVDMKFQNNLFVNPLTGGNFFSGTTGTLTLTDDHNTLLCLQGATCYSAHGAPQGFSSNDEGYNSNLATPTGPYLANVFTASSYPTNNFKFDLAQATTTGAALAYTDPNGIVAPQGGIYNRGAFEFAGIAPPWTVTIGTNPGNATGTVTGDDGMNCTIPASPTAPTVVTCSENHNTNDTPTYTATAVTGSFIGWSGGGCSGTGTCKPTVTSNIGITASFQTAPTCSLSFASNSLNAPALASATTTLTGLSGPTSLWFIFGPAPDNLPIFTCEYPYSGCTANGQTGNIIPVGSGLYSLGACSNGVCCTGSTAPLNINTGAGSAAH